MARPRQFAAATRRFSSSLPKPPSPSWAAAHRCSGWSGWRPSMETCALRYGRPAWSRATTQLALRIGGALKALLVYARPLRRGAALVVCRASALSAGTSLAVRARALNSAGFLALYQSDTDEARALLTEALAVVRGRPAMPSRPPMRCRIWPTVLENLATVLQYQDDCAHAREMHEESVRLFRSIRNMRGVALGLYGLGNIAESSDSAARRRALPGKPRPSSVLLATGVASSRP